MAYTTDDISGFYKQYLGRDLVNEGEAQGWLDNPNAEDMIRNSGEAQEYKKKGQAGSPWEQTPVTSYPQPHHQTYGSAPYGGSDPFAAERAAVSANPHRSYGNSGIEQQFRNLWAATPDHSPANLARLAAQFGLKTSGTHGDKVTMPDGRVIDAIMDVGGKNLPGWIDTSVQGGVSSGSRGSGDSGFSMQGGSGSGSSSSSGYKMGGQWDELYNMLLGRAQQGLNIGRTDANIRAQADPYSAQVEREKRNYLADMAERSGPLANLRGETRLASERAGQATGLFESQLIGREMQARRDEIAQALASMQGMLSQEQQLAMQRELANLDASIRNRQISSGNDQFMASLGLQAENQDNYWDWQRQGGF